MFINWFALNNIDFTQKTYFDKIWTTLSSILKNTEKTDDPFLESMKEFLKNSHFNEQDLGHYV